MARFISRQIYEFAFIRALFDTVNYSQGELHSEVFVCDDQATSGVAITNRFKSFFERLVLNSTWAEFATVVTYGTIGTAVGDEWWIIEAREAEVVLGWTGAIDPEVVV